MTDYSELVKKLRDLHRDPRPASVEWLFENQVALYDAAAAIEALQAQLPKRGEWVDGDNFEDPFLGKFQCSVCGHAVQAIEYNYEQKTVRFSSGKTKYCPNCGAKMTEVQYGK